MMTTCDAVTAGDMKIKIKEYGKCQVFPLKINIK
jgi:hypothetical protein